MGKQQKALLQKSKLLGLTYEPAQQLLFQLKYKEIVDLQSENDTRQEVILTIPKGTYSELQ